MVEYADSLDEGWKAPKSDLSITESGNVNGESTQAIFKDIGSHDFLPSANIVRAFKLNSQFQWETKMTSTAVAFCEIY